MTLQGRSRAVVGLMVAALIATSCGSSAETVDPPTTTRAPDTTTTTSGATPEPVPEPDPEPEATFWSDVLSVGDCILRESDGELPTIVSCDEPHEEEIYAIAKLDDGPDAPYPGQNALIERVSSELCDQATVDFGGEAWDQLPFQRAGLFPIEEEWAAGDRGIMCSAASSESGDLKVGTAAGGSLDTDDVILARATLMNEADGFKDWMLLREGASIEAAGSLTEGQFDLPLRRPFQVAKGFIFNSRLLDDDSGIGSTWGLNWDTGKITDLNSVLPEVEVADTMIVNGNNVFAARTGDGDDWDLWVAANGEAQVLVDGPGDQHYPTFTPTGDEVVYHDEGDIWIVNTDGSDPRRLTSGPDNDWESAVSPDGSTVVFSSDRDGNDDIWSVNINGGEPVNLTNHPGDEIWPFFSEDGSRIYFSSDRLRPEDDVATLMMMNADGSNQSWFSQMNSSHALLVRDQIAAQALAAAPTLNERYNYDRVGGTVGTTVAWEHSSGRLGADLPAGWRVAELDGDVIGFITSPKIDTYFETWEVDGVLVTLHGPHPPDDFFALVDETAVATDPDCERFDGTGEVLPGAAGDLFTANYNCGPAIAGVIALYDVERVTGVIIEGQRDNLPEADSDSALITDIAISVSWE